MASETKIDQSKTGAIKEIELDNGNGGTYKMAVIAEASADPVDTYRRAEALAAQVFPREPGVEALLRLHQMGHGEALYVAEDARKRVMDEEMERYMASRTAGTRVAEREDHEEC